MIPAFEDVYEDNVFRVYGFFAYRLRSREDAEDLTQLTFERALRAWGRYDPGRSPPGTWLFAIAHNLLIDRFRTTGAAPPTEPFDETAAEQSARRDLHSLGIAPELARALAALDQRAQELVALRFGGDLSGPEIAQLTGLTLANVQQILSRSLRRLRSDLEGGDEEQQEP